MSQTTSTKPKYEIIKDDLLLRIRSNDFSYEEVFCTEKQISEQYQVSRITAKRAILDLEQMGILCRKRGVGSFVDRNASNNLNHPQTVAADNSVRMVSLLLPFDVTKGGMFQAIEVINNKLNANDYLMSIYVSGMSANGQKEKGNIRLMLSQNLSGLIYYPNRDKINLSLLNEFVFRQIPVVVIDKTTDCPYIHNIVSDNFGGGRMLAEHLLSLGHRNITFLTTAPIESTSTVRNRFGGVFYALQKAGIAPPESILTYYEHEITEEEALSDTLSGIQALVRSLYQSGVTAIIAENDRVAQFLYMACSKIGLRIPDDLSICGFDNVEVSRTLGITTVQQDFKQIGEAAAQALLSSLEDFSAPFQKITVPVKLLPRRSTGLPRAID